MTASAPECTLCKGLTPPPGARCKACGRSSPEPRPHTCHARGCTTPVQPEMLMCFPHWRKVPRRVQKAVWAAYRPGQCDDMDVSKAWLLAADAAIGAVAVKEGLGISANEKRALESFKEEKT